MLEIMHMERTITSVPRSAPEGVWVPGRGIEIPCEYGCEKRLRQHKTISPRRAEVKEKKNRRLKLIMWLLIVSMYAATMRTAPSAEKVRNGPASGDQGCLMASQGSCHTHGTQCWNPPASPYPTSLLVQNLFSKWIAPTDNKWSIFDVAKRRHQWLIG